MNQSKHPRSFYRNAALVVLAIVLTTAASGYFMGLLQTSYYAEKVRERYRGEETAVAEPRSEMDQRQGGIQPMVDYLKMGEALFKPNTNWESSPTTLPRPEPQPEDFQPPIDKNEALARRAERRAYEGAPPVIPHAIYQFSSATCLTCHGQPVAIGDLVPPVMSHENLANCTQCHVAMKPPSGISFSSQGPSESNRFHGLEAPEKGERAYPGAPPVMPHTTWMRSHCLSCHGIAAAPALRTTHPDRLSCTQCHVASAVLSQRESPLTASPRPSNGAAPETGNR